MSLTWRCRWSAENALLPIFFTGATSALDLARILSGAVPPIAFLLVLVFAVVPKMLSAACSAWVMGMSLRDGTTLATLVNCRGMTELVILGVGLDQGLIGAEVFAVLVVMALISTAMTGPLLSVLRHPDVMSATNEPTGDVVASAVPNVRSSRRAEQAASEPPAQPAATSPETARRPPGDASPHPSAATHRPSAPAYEDQ